MEPVPPAPAQLIRVAIDRPLNKDVVANLTCNTKSFVEVLRRMEMTKVFQNYEVRGDSRETVVQAALRPPYLSLHFFPNKKAFLSGCLRLTTNRAPKSLGREILEAKASSLLLLPPLLHRPVPAFHDLLLEQFDKFALRLTIETPVFWRLSRFGVETRVGVRTKGIYFRMGAAWSHLHPGLRLRLFRQLCPGDLFANDIECNRTVFKAKYRLGQAMDSEAPSGARGAFKFAITPFAGVLATGFQVGLKTFQWARELWGVPFLNFEAENCTTVGNVNSRDFFNQRGFPCDLNRNNQGGDVDPGRARPPALRSFGSLKWVPISQAYGKGRRLNLFGFASGFVHDCEYFAYEYGVGLDTELWPDCRLEFLYNAEAGRPQLRFARH